MFQINQTKTENQPAVEMIFAHESSSMFTFRSLCRIRQILIVYSHTIYNYPINSDSLSSRPVFVILRGSGLDYDGPPKSVGNTVYLAKQLVIFPGRVDWTPLSPLNIH